MCNATPIERWIIVQCLADWLADWLTDWLSERGKYANFATDATTLFPNFPSFSQFTHSSEPNEKTIKLWMLCCTMLVAWNLLPCCDKRDGEALSPTHPLLERQQDTSSGSFTFDLCVCVCAASGRPAAAGQQVNVPPGRMSNVTSH